MCHMLHSEFLHLEGIAVWLKGTTVISTSQVVSCFCLFVFEVVLGSCDLVTWKKANAITFGDAE